MCHWSYFLIGNGSGPPELAASRGLLRCERRARVGAAPAQPGAVAPSTNLRCQSSSTRSAQIRSALSAVPASLSRTSAPDRRGVEEASLPHRSGREAVVDEWAEVLVDPGPERCAEARLGPPDDRLGKHTLHRLLEHVLAGRPPELQPGGNVTSEVDQLVVEQRDPDLGRRRHAHPVRVGEVEARQERLHVEVQQAVQPDLAGSARRVLAVAVKRVVGAELGAKIGAQEARELLGSVVGRVGQVAIHERLVEAAQQLHRVTARSAHPAGLAHRQAAIQRGADRLRRPRGKRSTGRVSWAARWRGYPAKISSAPIPLRITVSRSLPAEQIR